jgi:very-short-patch-repair endonuclease
LRRLRIGFAGRRPVKRKRKKGPTPAQLLLATHLRELGVRDVEFEYQFLADRKFRFDLYSQDIRIGFEACGGTWNGGHRRRSAIELDYEKANLAQLHGFRMLQFTNRQIESGEAKEFLKTFLWGGID